MMTGRPDLMSTFEGFRSLWMSGGSKASWISATASQSPGITMAAI